MTTRIRKAVIPVAGFGTRFLPVSKSIPKEMLPIVNKPIIEYIVREFTESGIDEIIFISSSNKHALEDYFDYNNELDNVLRAAGKDAALKESRDVAEMARYIYVRQREQLGNGHALLMAKHLIGDEPFAFAYGDDVYDANPPAISQMMETFAQHQGTVFGTVEVPESMVNRYGIIETEPLEGASHRVTRVIEKPDPSETTSRLAVAGRYIFTPSIFEALESVGPGKNGEIWVNDGIAKLMEHEPAYARVIDGTYHDCGNVTEYLKTVVHYGLKDPAVDDGFRSWLEAELQA